MTMYSTQFSSKEFFFLLFKKKICPVCKERLIKQRKKEYLGKGYDYSPTLEMGYYGDKFHVKIFYKCDKCDKLFSLKELTNKNL